MPQPNLHKKYYNTLVQVRQVLNDTYLTIVDAVNCFPESIVTRHTRPLIDASGINMVLEKFIKTHDPHHNYMNLNYANYLQLSNFYVYSSALPSLISTKTLSNATKLLTFINSECKSIVASLPAIRAAIEAEINTSKKKNHKLLLKAKLDKVDAAIDAMPAEFLANIADLANYYLNSSLDPFLKKPKTKTNAYSQKILIRRVLAAIKTAAFKDKTDKAHALTLESFRNSLHETIVRWLDEDQAYIGNIKDAMSSIDMMPNIVTELTKLLKSMQTKLKKTSETPKGDKGKLGRVALGQNRIDGVPYEKNTKIEDELFDELLGHFNHESKLDKKSVAMIKQFIKTGEYSKVFTEPDKDIVYRGMGVSWEWLEKVLGKKRSKIPNRGSITRNITYTPITSEGTSSSWSTEKKRAERFGEDNNKKFEGGVGTSYCSHTAGTIGHHSHRDRKGSTASQTSLHMRTKKRSSGWARSRRSSSSGTWEASDSHDTQGVQKDDVHFHSERHQRNGREHRDRSRVKGASERAACVHRAHQI